jgi:hypothetical protein
MSGRMQVAGGYRSAAIVVLLAFCAGVRGLGFYLTAREAAMETATVCDENCRAAWRVYAARGDRWCVVAVLLLLVAVALFALVRRSRLEE